MAHDNVFGGLMSIGSVFVRATQKMEIPGQGTVWIIEEITPEIAQGILAGKHPDQRNVRANHVARIAGALERGDYVWTADPIKFDRMWRCVDGQHRLNAIVASGVTVKNVMIAQIGDDQILKYLDAVAAPRSLGDVRRITGAETVHTGVMAAILLECSDFKYSKRQLLTKPQAADIVTEFKWLQEAKDLYRVGRDLRVTSGALAGALRCVRKNRDAAMKFFMAAFANDHTIDGKPDATVKLLADSLLRQQRMRAEKTKDPNDDAMTGAAKCIRAYNAWITGEKLSQLLRPKSGVIPEPIR